jgi:Kef-type K+ transport system membrane component KefB
MSPFIQLALILSIIVFMAKLSGYLSTRIGQPSVFGELVVGLLLGPSLLNITHLYFITDPHIDEVIREMAEIGVLMLMFLAGMELQLSEMARNTRVAAYAGLLGVLIPVGLGGLVGYLFGLPLNSALFLGLTLGATSVSISAQTLMELNVLRSRVGLGLLGAAVFDDIIVILLLSTFTALLMGGGGGGFEVLLIIGRMILFLTAAVGIGLFIVPRLVRITARLPISQGMIALALVVLFMYGVAAELIGGMAAITGTFVAGLMFGRTAEKKRVEFGMHALAYGLFVPIFFVDIGLQVNIRSLDASALWLLLVICLIGIFGKIFGSGIGAKLAGYSWLESTQLGIGMVSRGEVGLIVASVGLNAGLLTDRIFSAIIGMVLITTLVTPPLLRASFQKKSSPKTVSEEKAKSA